MNIEKIIKTRHSVRSYLDKKIEDEKIEVLNILIDECNKESGLNIQLILDDKDVFDNFKLHYGRLENAKNYLAMVGKKDKKTDEKVGYYGEKIVLKAWELGLNTCWVAGTYSKGSVKANINKDEKLICVIAIGYGKTNGVERKSKTFDDVSISKNVPTWYKKGVEYSLYAPTAINEQKFKFELVDDETVSCKAGLGPMTKIDLGIVKYHFELGANKKFKWK